MLRPERMSRVSVTGARRVMDDVIDAVHDLELLHVTEYDGSWEGFEPGDPSEGADEASNKLVTVRSLQSILGVDADDAGPVRRIDDEELEEELEAIRTEVNELDDRRGEIRDELREIEERIDRMEPFVDLGIDVDLLSGYETLAVAVGEGDDDAIEDALEDAGIEHFELYEGDDEDVVAVFAYTDEDALQDALVDARFTTIERPEIGAESEENADDTSPADHLDQLRRRREQLESKLATVEDELEELRLSVGGFLLAAEEHLAIHVEKEEAPLSFATTANSFVAEGWIPADRYDEFVAALDSAVGDHVEVEELEQASYDREVHHDETEAVAEEAGTGSTAPSAAATEDGEGPTADAEGEETGETVADGGVVTMRDDDPPVVQRNPGIVKPFELLTQAVGRPKYTELDPTFILFLTFPLMFGFMIGDVGYGVIYTAIGAVLYTRFEGSTWKNFGIITMAAGLATFVFGIIYGEIFGLHLVTTYLWEPLIGGAPLHKGLMPTNKNWALAWFLITALFGVFHMTVGYVFEFVENNALHGFKAAVLETGSWILALTGLWMFIFSDVARSSKPKFIFEVFNEGEAAAFQLGFAGLPEWAGILGIGMVLLGAVLIAIGPSHELVEIHSVLAHALSYLRIAAVLLAKAGMAFSVNLLFFGAYETHGEYHFMLSHGPEYVLSHHEEASILFGGMLHGGLALAAFGVLVLLLGHVIVLILGVTSSGIQAIRLEYFEFFSKFYDGGGTTYDPFGYVRNYTTEE